MFIGTLGNLAFYTIIQEVNRHDDAVRKFNMWIAQYQIVSLLSEHKRLYPQSGLPKTCLTLTVAATLLAFAGFLIIARFQ
jgi:hypothetical protein